MPKDHVLVILGFFLCDLCIHTSVDILLCAMVGDFGVSTGDEVELFGPNMSSHTNKCKFVELQR